MRLCAAEGDTEKVEMLLKGSTVGTARPPVMPDEMAADGCTALMLAVLGGHAETAGLLMARGAASRRR